MIRLCFFFPLSSLPSHLFYSLSPRVLPGSKLQFSKLTAEVPVMFRVVELPQKHHICKVKSLNKGDANSEVTVYYQVYTHNVHARLQVIKSFYLWRFIFYAHKFIPIFFLFAFYSVWPQGFKGAHADGAVGGEHYNMLLLCFHTLPLWCRHPSIVDWVVLGGGFRCTWRSPALISSGPKRLWGEFLLRSIIFFCSFKTKFLKLSETVSFSIQISITR